MNYTLSQSSFKKLYELLSSLLQTKIISSVVFIPTTWLSRTYLYMKAKYTTLNYYERIFNEFIIS